MKLFTLIWWIAMLLLFSFLMIDRAGLVLKGFDMPSMHLGDIIIFLVWTALLLWPLFGEIDLLGLRLKKEINSLKSEVREVREQSVEFKEQILNLKSEINIRSLIAQQVNVYGYPYEGTRPSSPVRITPQDLDSKELSGEALKVLSTLWKHQQQYDPKIWGFVVWPRSLHYGTYVIGVGETMKLGLTGINPENGMVFLTVEGVNYCKKHEQKLLSIDWDYSRWQVPV